MSYNGILENIIANFARSDAYHVCGCSECRTMASHEVGLKAAQLLLRHLTPAQAMMLAQSGVVQHVSPTTKILYQLSAGPERAVEATIKVAIGHSWGALSGAQPGQTFTGCIHLHPPTVIPGADHLLGKLLWLRAEERAFVIETNWVHCVGIPF